MKLSRWYFVIAIAAYFAIGFCCAQVEPSWVGFIAALAIGAFAGITAGWVMQDMESLGG